MDWKNKANVSSKIVHPNIAPFMMKNIRLNKPLELADLDVPDIEYMPEKELKKPMTIKTDFGVIWIQSKNCIQISHVKNPDHMEYLEKFIYNILFKKEKRSFIDWLREQDEKFERDLGVRK